MNQICIEMPVVATCMVSACAYNTDRNCHARAITIGDGVSPGCDTFLMASRHTRDDRLIAGVGACKVERCRHNKEFECMADGIRVDVMGSHAHCVTFDSRVG